METVEKDYSGIWYNEIEGSWCDADGVPIERPEQPMHAQMWLEALPLEIEVKGKKKLTAYRGDMVVTLPGLTRVVMTRAEYERRYGPQRVSPYWESMRPAVGETRGAPR